MLDKEGRGSVDFDSFVKLPLTFRPDLHPYELEELEIAVEKVEAIADCVKCGEEAMERSVRRMTLHRHVIAELKKQKEEDDTMHYLIQDDLKEGILKGLVRPTTAHPEASSQEGSQADETSRHRPRLPALPGNLLHVSYATFRAYYESAWCGAPPAATAGDQPGQANLRVMVSLPGSATGLSPPDRLSLVNSLVSHLDLSPGEVELCVTSPPPSEASAPPKAPMQPSLEAEIYVDLNSPSIQGGSHGSQASEFARKLATLQESPLKIVGGESLETKRTRLPALAPPAFNPGTSQGHTISISARLAGESMKFPALPPGSPAQCRFLDALAPLMPLPVQASAIRVLSSRIVDDFHLDVKLRVHFSSCLDKEKITCEGIASSLTNKTVADYTLSFVDVAHMSYSQEPSPQKAVMAHDWSHRVGEPNLKGIYTRDCWNDTSNEEFLHHFQGWLEHEGVPVPGAESERVNSRAEAQRAT